MGAFASEKVVRHHFEGCLKFKRYWYSCEKPSEIKRNLIHKEFLWIPYCSVTRVTLTNFGTFGILFLGTEVYDQHDKLKWANIKKPNNLTNYGNRKETRTICLCMRSFYMTSAN